MNAMHLAMKYKEIVRRIDIALNVLYTVSLASSAQLIILVRLSESVPFDQYVSLHHLHKPLSMTSSTVLFLIHYRLSILI